MDKGSLKVMVLLALIGFLYAAQTSVVSADSWAARNQIAAFAKAQVGKPYSMESDKRLGPDYFDCSGLVWRAYESAGVILDNTMCDWIAYEIDRTTAQPGDLVYMGYEPRPEHIYPTGYHVGVYVGDGFVVHASGTRLGVVMEPIGARTWTWCGRVPALLFSDGDRPVRGDFNGDGKEDIGIYRQAGSPAWFFKTSNGNGLDESTTTLNWGFDGATPFTGDFDGDGKDDIGLFRRGTFPNWNIKLATASGFSETTYTLAWGNPSGDIPVVGDFNGDGKADIALKRAEGSPNWFFKYSTGTPGVLSWDDNINTSLHWGDSGDIPVVGDFNGDKRDDLGLYCRGSAQNWRIKYSTGTAFVYHESIFSWGNGFGEIPLASDFDGDGYTDIGIYRRGSYPNWFFKRGGPAGFAPETFQLNWGDITGDVPIVGDFDGDGKADIAINRFGANPNWYFKLSNGTYIAGQSAPFAWGNPGTDYPTVGYFNQDIMTDLALHRTDGYPNWFFKISTGSGFAASASSLAWGDLDDQVLIADLNGDGLSELITYRRGVHPNWFFKFGTSSGFAAQSYSLAWGDSGDDPIIGDFNGDGKDDIGIHRSGSYPNWYVLISTASGTSPAWGEVWSSSWGNLYGDLPLTGNFNGDIAPGGTGLDDIAIYRRGTYPNWFFKTSTGSGFAASASSVAWGDYGDNPITGDFNGDGKTDIGLHRDSSSGWFFKLADASGFSPNTYTLLWNSGQGNIPLVGDFNGDLIADVAAFSPNRFPNWRVNLLHISTGNTIWDNDSQWALSWGNSMFQFGYSYYMLESADEMSTLRCARE